MARGAQGFVGMGAPCASQKATVPEFPVTSAGQRQRASWASVGDLLAVNKPWLGSSVQAIMGRNWSLAGC
jgi:hypothetical protein